MLNKQTNDPDVTGAGRFVEETSSTSDSANHPLQALNRQARKDPNFLDDGRREITGRTTTSTSSRGDDAAAQRRPVLLPQRLVHEREGRRAVLQRRCAANAQSGAASTLSTRFTNPATWPASRPGLTMIKWTRSPISSRTASTIRVRALRSRLTDEDVPADRAGLHLLGLPSGSRGTGRH